MAEIIKINNKLIKNESGGVNISGKQKDIIFCLVNWTYLLRGIEQKV